MTSNWQYSVTWFDINNLATSQDITNDVISIPLFTDTGSPEINTAKLVLSANNGTYIGLSPIIKQYDRIMITVLDGASHAYSNTFEVKKTTPVEAKGIGTRLEVTLVGLERHLQRMNYIKPFYFADAFSVSKDIGQYFNTNRGTLQPTLAGHDNTTVNKLPAFTTNIYNYGVNEDTCFNRLQDVIDKLGASVDAGGVLDFFEMNFNCTDAQQLNIKLFSSGDTTGYTPIILQDTNTVNVGETEAGIEAFEGSNIGIWGDQALGSIPVEFSKFAAKQQAFPLYPTWDASLTYPLGAIVQLQGITYQSTVNNNHNSDPRSGFTSGWNIVDQASIFGNVITYSPWTKDRKQLWANSGSDLSSNFYGPGCWDSNLVVADDQTFRTWVHFKATDPTQISTNTTWQKWMYFDGTTRKFYRGFRLLVNGIGTGAFSGNDSNGIPFSNSVVQYDGSKWTVLYQKSNNMMISVIYEGINYAYNPTLGWLDLFHNQADGSVGPQGNGNDCFHPYFSISNKPGILAKVQSDGTETDTPFTANTNSAIEYEYRWSILDFSASDTNYYSIGAWANFDFPFPTSTFGGIAEKVGQYYGGSIATGQEPATFDTQNMHMTHDGKRGFNNTSSEDYGQCQSLDFWVRLKYQGTVITDPSFSSAVLPIGEANFKMRCVIYDTADNVMYQDFIIPFNNNWESIKLPISNFQRYVGRTPVHTLESILIPPKALSPTNIFQWRNLKKIVIQTQESYDENGRYSPIATNENLLSPTRWYNPIAGITTQESTILRRIQLRIDGFRFTKPLLVLTGPYSDRDIEPDFLNKIDIGNYDQLKNEALTEREKMQYQRIEFDLGTTGLFDIQQGQTFYYRNPRLVNFSDMAPDGISANTVKLVAKRIEYSITKPSKLNKGGFLRTIIGIRRFV